MKLTTLHFLALIIIVLLNFSFDNLKAQSPDIPIGIWRHHLPNSSVVAITQAGNIVYAATPYGILEYDKNHNSIRKIDKVDGLSDFGISTINYSSEKELLMLGYQNGNIDVIMGKQIFSIPDIRQASILGSKRINSITFENNRAYLSSDFGIVILDLNQFVILDTWFIGPEGSQMNVFDLLITDNMIYAATEAGLLRALKNAPNLADFQYWNPVNDLPAPNGRYTQVILHNDILMTSYSGTAADTVYYYSENRWNVFNPFGGSGFYGRKRKLRSENNKLFIGSHQRADVFDENLGLMATMFFYADRQANPNDGFVDSNNQYWIADISAGLIKGSPATGFESVILSGPATQESFRIAHNGGTLWVASGAIIGGWQPTWSDRGVFFYDQGKWSQFHRSLFPEIDHIRDVHHVGPHTQNPNRVFAAAWSGGLMEFDKNDGLISLYDERNSTLQKRAGVDDIIRLGGSAMDRDGNLWVSNSDADHFLSVRKANGDWISFPHNGLISNVETLGPIVIDNFDQKWVSMPRGGGVIVFKEQSLENNNTFEIKKLSTQEGNGSLPSTTVPAIAKDKDGYIWLGTTEGVVVFYSPQQAFRGVSFDAQSVIVVQDGFAGRLFENETINTIFVDGSNKKWFGTRSSGAFLLSSDARETLVHFTRSNSPLPSNNILDISIEPSTGEIFFATDAGLVSYRGFATEGQRQHTDVYAFPNPVRPGYTGYIAVKGLVTNARVKITDISGNLVYDTFAEGGQMVWDGKDIFGRRPASGVYLVFSTDPDGTETVVTKILFMN